MEIIIFTIDTTYTSGPRIHARTYLYDGEMWDILHRLNSSVKGQSKNNVS